MELTFEIPKTLVKRFHDQVPKVERSKFLADLLSRNLELQNVLEEAALNANALQNVARDMKDWEALNGH